MASYHTNLNLRYHPFIFRQDNSEGSVKLALIGRVRYMISVLAMKY